MKHSGYWFEKDIRVRIQNSFAGRAPHLNGGLPFRLFNLMLLWLLIIYAILVVPNRILDPQVLQITYTIAVLAAWRFSWWFNHAIRAEVFGAFTFPKMRVNADLTWSNGWRPRHVHFMVTTYYEKPEITRKVLRSILDEIHRTNVEATIWFGTGSAFDENVIREYMDAHGRDINGQLVFVRQNQPGKRMAIGTVMRAIIRSGPHPDDIIMFMDGDSVLEPRTLQKCSSLFGADPELQALTTNECVIVYGPKWLQSWLSMRFAQRSLAMKSHALSGRVLTLTGRMSVFRAREIINEDFVRTVESDHLDHWLWGRFRFLSGDDKSTWFYLLSKNAKMTYVPDVMVTTIEVIEGSARTRMVQNLRRWSGNMLRNGARAIALGPRRMPLFIWLCLVDQRLAMWTMMVSPVLIIYAAFFVPAYVASGILWILLSRCFLSLALYRHSGQIDPSWPILLYINQVLNATVKVYMVFRLAQQVWANRGNQRAGHGKGFRRTIKNTIANFQMITLLSGFVWGLVWLAGGIA